MKRWILPGAFALLVLLLAVGLTLDPRRVPSPLIDKAAPSFQLPRLDDRKQVFDSASMRGHVWLLNVWASWCVACRAEHPLLVELAGRRVVEIVGLNYKDDPADARAWLGRLGNPYQVSASDLDGRVGIDWGVYGVPETFVIDGTGVIRYKQIGPLTREAIEDTVLPLVRSLQEKTP